MRRYETIIIIDPDLSKEERDPLFEKFKELISQHKGYLVEVDEWGTQKLAYEIRKKTRGHYIRLDYCGAGELVSELERFCRINDRVLKYLTVLLENKADVESLKQETSEAEIKEEPSDNQAPDQDTEEESPVPEPEQKADLTEETQEDKEEEEI